MPLDSREKRASAVTVGLPWRGMYPVGDGTIAQGARPQAAAFYRGIAASGGGPSAPFTYARLMIPPGWRRSGQNA